MSKVILAAQTAAGNSTPVNIGSGEVIGVFTCPGIAGAETATLQKLSSAGTWIAVASADRATIINTTQTYVKVDFPGIYRIAKGITVAAVPIEVSTLTDP